MSELPGRRDFIAAVAGAASVTLAGTVTGCMPRPAGQRILVLGGTNFVGPAIVEEALARGHDVTLFNRGVTRPHLFPETEKLRGTRSTGGSDLGALGGGRRWDAVIDVWPEERQLVEETAGLLRDRTEYYFYVSSIAVYADYSRPGILETAPVHAGPVGFYGAEKAAAEAHVAALFPGRFGVARCPAIVGPRDPGAAYHFWLRRLATRAEVLCPGDGLDPVQAIDVRDLAAWTVDAVEARRAGVHNLTGPWPPTTMREFLEATRDGIGSTARLTWADADFLRRDQRLQSFSNIPMWAPLDEDEGFYQVDGSAALAAGASYRPASDTAAAAWAWYQSHFFKDTQFPTQGVGIGAEREDEVLAAWHARG